MRDIRHGQEGDALRVPVTIVSVSMLAIGMVLLSTLALTAALAGKSTIATAVLRYALPCGALAVIITTLNIRRLLTSLVFAQRELCEREADARFLAMHHAVSRLPNRRHFIQALRERLAPGEDAASPSICVILIRLDGVSTIAQSSGRRAADALAAQIAPRLTPLLKADDLLAQLANDLFAVVCRVDLDDDGSALRKQLLAVLHLPFDLAGEAIALFASAGVTVALGKTDPEQVLADAEGDLARVSADWKGRDRRRLRLNG
jgi:diguanylate cyclase (GGDEF)-like protein